MSSKLKQALMARCREIVSDNISSINIIIDNIQDAANEEIKSSAGDKYETGREMMRMEKEKAQIQLEESSKLLKALDQITLHESTDTVQMGSLVLTDSLNFFISVPIGKLVFEQNDYYIISPVSPLGKELINRKVGDKVVLNNQTYLIRRIY